jgi:hypothetical protein
MKPTRSANVYSPNEEVHFACPLNYVLHFTQHDSEEKDVCVITKDICFPCLCCSVY